MLSQKWYAWFAWYPVRVNDKWCWGRTIERRGCEDMGGTWTEYRERQFRYQPQKAKAGQRKTTCPSP